MVSQRIKPSPRPSQAAVPEEVPLDGQDLAMPRMCMHCTWFFLSSKQPSLKELSLQDLQQAFTAGMQLFLARFPGAAARTRYDQDTERWYLQYNDQGADLDVVEVDHPLGDGWKGLNGKFDPALAPRPVMIVDDDASVFATKVTRFSCGSITISTSTHHWLVDFCGYVDLMEELAKSVAPFLDGASPQADAETEANKFDWSRDLVSYAKQVEPEPIPSETWYTERGSPPQMTRMPSGCRYASLLFTTASLKKLKRSLEQWALEAGTDSTTNRTLPSKENWIGTNDALHALLWAAITDARSLKLETTTQLHTPLDGRRLLTPLSSSSTTRGKYIGNVHPGHVLPLTSNLVSTTPSSLFHLAWLIRTQYLTLTSGQMSSIIRHHNYCDEKFGPGRLPKCTSMFGNDITISNVARLPARERLDFGSKLGKPYSFTVIGMVPVTLNGLTLDSADGTCFILPAPGAWGDRESALLHQPQQGDKEEEMGLVAYVGMRDGEMDKLLQNDVLRQFAVVL